MLPLCPNLVLSSRWTYHDRYLCYVCRDNISISPLNPSPSPFPPLSDSGIHPKTSPPSASILFPWPTTSPSSFSRLPLVGNPAYRSLNRSYFNFCSLLTLGRVFLAASLKFSVVTVIFLPPSIGSSPPPPAVLILENKDFKARAEASRTRAAISAPEYPSHADEVTIFEISS